MNKFFENFAKSIDLKSIITISSMILNLFFYKEFRMGISQEQKNASLFLLEENSKLLKKIDASLMILIENKQVEEIVLNQLSDEKATASQYNVLELFNSWGSEYSGLIYSILFFGAMYWLWYLFLAGKNSNVTNQNTLSPERVYYDSCTDKHLYSFDEVKKLLTKESLEEVQGILEDQPNFISFPCDLDKPSVLTPEIQKRVEEFSRTYEVKDVKKILEEVLKDD